MKKPVCFFLLIPLCIFGKTPGAEKGLQGGDSAKAGIHFEHGTFAEVLSKAQKENKMIMVDAFTTWCGPCKWMAKNIFTNDTVGGFYNKN